jgi:hypothetical protein
MNTSIVRGRGRGRGRCGWLCCCCSRGVVGSESSGGIDALGAKDGNGGDREASSLGTHHHKILQWCADEPLLERRLHGCNRAVGPTVQVDISDQTHRHDVERMSQWQNRCVEPTTNDDRPTTTTHKPNNSWVQLTLSGECEKPDWKWICQATVATTMP